MVSTVTNVILYSNLTRNVVECLNFVVEFAEDVELPPTTPQKTTQIPRSTIKPSTSTWQQGNRVQFISNNSHSNSRQSTIRSSGN